MARSLGIAAPVGDPSIPPLERNWARPTLDLNGIWGGFQGEGSKTVIPARGARQDHLPPRPRPGPGRVIAAIERHVAKHTARPA